MRDPLISINPMSKHLVVCCFCLFVVVCFFKERDVAQR